MEIFDHTEQGRPPRQVMNTYRIISWLIIGMGILSLLLMALQAAN